MIPQYRTLKSKLSKYRWKKSSIPQYRKPHFPLHAAEEVFLLRAFLRKPNIRKESSIQFQGKSLTLTEHSPSVFVTVTVSDIILF